MKKDGKIRYEIPAPLCGLVFIRFTSENFDCTLLCCLFAMDISLSAWALQFL